MARYAIGGKATVAGTSARAQVSLFGIANIGCRVVEIMMTNTTATETELAPARFTNATNVGTGLTEAEYDENAPAPSCTGFAGHTGDGGVGQIFPATMLGAAKGAGYTWSFGDGGIVIQPGTTNGLGVLVPSGTGQICMYGITWDE